MSLTGAEVLEQLRRVTSLRFDAYSEMPADWNGTGSGEVRTETRDGSLLFHETGTWRSTLPFRNVYRWTSLDDARLRLEHLRGPEPVHLFDLEPDGVVWRPAVPHLCDEDVYTAELRTTTDGIELRWTITGPQKRSTLRYSYIQLKRAGLEFLATRAHGTFA